MMKIIIGYIIVLIVIVVCCVVLPFSCNNNSTTIQRNGKIIPQDSLGFHSEKLGKVGDSYVYKITYEGRSYIMLDPDHEGYTGTLIKQ